MCGEPAAKSGRRKGWALPYSFFPGLPLGLDKDEMCFPAGQKFCLVRFCGFSILFTDRQIAGRQCTLSFEEWTGRYDASDLPPLTVRLYSLSEEYCRCLFSVGQTAGSTLDEALGNHGFGEPLRVCSNVEGGTGILGACCVSEKKVTGIIPSV